MVEITVSMIQAGKKTKPVDQRVASSRRSVHCSAIRASLRYGYSSFHNCKEASIESHKSLCNLKLFYYLLGNFNSSC